MVSIPSCSHWQQPSDATRLGCLAPSMKSLSFSIHTWVDAARSAVEPFAGEARFSSYIFHCFLPLVFSFSLSNNAAPKGKRKGEASLVPRILEPLFHVKPERSGSFQVLLSEVWKIVQDFFIRHA